MVCLALQFGLQPLFTKACIHENAHKPSLVLLCEIMKMFLALILLFLDPTCKKVLEKWSLRETFSKAGVPAAVYAFQNVCIQVSYQNTDPLTFNLLNQLKIVFTAIMVYVLLGKTQTGQQIIALFLLLVVGVVLCLPEGVLTGDIESSFAAIQGKNDFMYGIVPCLVASICSGFASAYSQMVMSGKGQRNAYLFSAELSFCSGLFLLAGNIYTSIINGNNGGSSSLSFSNFINISSLGSLALIPLMTNASGGIFVGQVTKHAGSVRKVFCVVAGIIVTAIARTLYYADPVDVKIYVAMPIVLVSLIMYNNATTNSKISPTKPKTD